MKQQILASIEDAISHLQQQGDLPTAVTPKLQLERARDKSHGDYACNVALAMAKAAGQNPRQLAQKLVDAIKKPAAVSKIEIAGPGFINFFVAEAELSKIVAQVLQQQHDFGRNNQGENKKVLIEFVSVNPTGPLHVGHGRGAAVGSALAKIMAFSGYQVEREYYVNDAGRQMNILTASVWLRYLQSLGEDITFPKNGYQGDYIKDIAAKLLDLHSGKFKTAVSDIFANVPMDLQEDGSGDKEAHIDAIISNAKKILGQDNYFIIYELTLSEIMSDIRDDLAEFKVEFDNWFSEKQLVDNGAIMHTVKALKDKGLTYEKGGAIWFKATDFGDEKDRVLVRANGEGTYFVSDAAYHLHKIERGYDIIIDIFGADHHGYVSRIKAAVQALSAKQTQFIILLVQFAVLYRGKEKVQMSTRSGEFVTLRQLRQEVGSDSARLFYAWRRSDQHMDFDLELAKSQSNDNPLYYIQYAHARVCSVFDKLQQKELDYNEENGLKNLELLDSDEEKQLFTKLARFNEVVASAAANFEPHLLAHYLRDLATLLHGYYNTTQFLVEDVNSRHARLSLIKAVRQVLYNGLNLLGVSAPKSM